MELHKVHECHNCQQDFGEVVTNDHEICQVFYLPNVKLLVTDPQAEIKVCPHFRDKKHSAPKNTSSK